MGKVVVLGSINQDLIAICDKHPERGETVRGLGLLRVPGGKGANQSLAAASSGADATMIGAVGRDQDGTELVKFLSSRNVDVEHVRFDEVPTGTASIFVDLNGEISIVAVPGANEKVTDDLDVELDAGDVLVSQLEIPTASIQSFFARGRRNGCTTILNASPTSVVPRELSRLTDICVLNDRELARLIGVNSRVLTDQALITDAARQVPLADEGVMLVLHNNQDVLVVRDDSVAHVEGIQVKPVDTTGVEDCFIGTLAALLAEKLELDQAIQFASRAAAIASTRRGASMPSRDEILADAGA